jgi:hypothetical protein
MDRRLVVSALRLTLRRGLRFTLGLTLTLGLGLGLGLGFTRGLMFTRGLHGFCSDRAAKFESHRPSFPRAFHNERNASLINAISL